MITRAIAHPQQIKMERVICNDPSHCHRSPVQICVSFIAAGHLVEITNDGGRYNIRIDEGPARLNITRERMNEYIIRNLINE